MRVSAIHHQTGRGLLEKYKYLNAVRVKYSDEKVLGFYCLTVQVRTYRGLKST